jgi:hypothetical protein
MRYLSWQELVESDSVCKEVGDAVGDEELDALMLVYCTLQIDLPVTFFRLGHQRITWTVSVPVTSHEPRLRLLEGGVGSRRWAEVSAQADAEGVGFSRVRVVDCFMFNNELDMLELRLLNHDQFADLIIIVESPTTHSGFSKPLVFQQARGQQALSLSRTNEHTLSHELMMSFNRQGTSSDSAGLRIRLSTVLLSFPLRTHSRMIGMHAPNVAVWCPFSISPMTT